MSLVKRQKITLEGLKTVLQNIKGAKIATIITETVPKLKKRDNPFTNVVKRSTLNMVFNFNYRSAVNKALGENNLTVRVPETPGKRTWGKHVPNTPFISHGPNLYLEVKLNRPADKVQYLDENGQILDKVLVDKFLYKRNPGLVPMNDINLKNIKELRVNKVQYVVSQ